MTRGIQGHANDLMLSLTRSLRMGFLRELRITYISAVHKYRISSSTSLNEISSESVGITLV